ncbi:MAG: T9SS type A sorting domain-containing protein, partial [Flavobacteriia bacterium]
GDVIMNIGSLDYWIVKINSLGNLIWEKSFGGTLDETPTSIQQTADGGFIIAGWSVSNDGDLTGSYGLGDYWILKLNNPTTGSEEFDNSILSVYPNPVKDILNIMVSKETIGNSYVIYDNQGRLALSGKINSENTTIELSGLSAGLYLFSLGEKWNQPFNVVKE